MCIFPLNILKEIFICLCVIRGFYVNLQYQCETPCHPTTYWIKSNNLAGRLFLPMGICISIGCAPVAISSRIPIGICWFCWTKIKRKYSDFDTYSYPFISLGYDYGVSVSAHLYTMDKWNAMSFSPFYHNVEHDKIVLIWASAMKKERLWWSLK